MLRPTCSDYVSSYSFNRFHLFHVIEFVFTHEGLIEIV